MAVNPKAVASWGLRAEATQIVSEMAITLAADEPLVVDLEAEEIDVELSDEQ